MIRLVTLSALCLVFTASYAGQLSNGLNGPGLSSGLNGPGLDAGGSGGNPATECAANGLDFTDACGTTQYMVILR